MKQDFFDVTPKSKLLELLEGINRKLGDLQRYEFKDWRFQVQLIGDSENLDKLRSAMVILLVYEATYIDGVANEQITLTKRDTDRGYKLTGYLVEADAFLKD